MCGTGTIGGGSTIPVSAAAATNTSATTTTATATAPSTAVAGALGGGGRDSLAALLSQITSAIAALKDALAGSAALGDVEGGGGGDAHAGCDMPCADPVQGPIQVPPSDDVSQDDPGQSDSPAQDGPAQVGGGGQTAEQAPAAKTYTVQPGDSLSKIAQRHGIADWRALYELNRDVVGPDPDLIHPGQVLTLPDGSSDPAPPTQAPASPTGDTSQGGGTTTQGDGSDAAPVAEPRPAPPLLDEDRLREEPITGVIVGEPSGGIILGPENVRLRPGNQAGRQYVELLVNGNPVQVDGAVYRTYSPATSGTPKLGDTRTSTIQAPYVVDDKVHNAEVTVRWTYAQERPGHYDSGNYWRAEFVEGTSEPR